MKTHLGFRKVSSVRLISVVLILFLVGLVTSAAVSGASGEAPAIWNVTPDRCGLMGGVDVVVDGQNLTAECEVTIGNAMASNVVVESPTRLHFTVPAQSTSGGSTLTVRTSGGLAQHVFNILPKSLSQLRRGEIVTVAGGAPYLGDGGLATEAGLSAAMGVAVDAAGNLLIADSGNSRIRRVDAASGVITTVAGGGSALGDGGPAVIAGLSYPSGVAVDAANDLFIADTRNSRIRRVDGATGIITTVAGGGGELGDGGPAASAGLNYPYGVEFDAAGNLFIADAGNSRIRRVDAATGIITTVAGTGAGDFSGDGGPATSAGLSYPYDVAIDAAGNLFIADTESSRIRRVDGATGIITTVAGGGELGDGGPATSAGLSSPYGVAVDAAGNLFIADTGSFRVRRVDGATGIITTVAGGGELGDGGPATGAALGIPFGLTLDAAGRLYIVNGSYPYSPAPVGDNSLISRVRRVEAATAVITTVAGSNPGGDGGLATSAGLAPAGVAVDAVGNLFIADTANSRIRRVDAATGVISTVAGTGTTGFSGDGGPATSAGLAAPYGVAVDAAGDLFIADTEDNRIRRVDATTGVITTVAGTGTAEFGGDGGPAISADLSYPRSVAVDAAGNLFIADVRNFRIRRVDAATGVITTVAGNGTQEFAGHDAAATSVGMYAPVGVALDGAGNLFIADAGYPSDAGGVGSYVLRVDAVTGVIHSVGAPVVSAQSLAIDAAGNLFFSDSYSVFGAAGRIARLKKTTGRTKSITGPGYALSFTMGIAFDAAGNLYFADVLNHAVRVVKRAGVAGPPGTGPRRR